MAKTLHKLRLQIKKISDGLPIENKLPFFTLVFTLLTLIITLTVVQQQQTLQQEAAGKKDTSDVCPTDSTGSGGGGKKDKNGNGQQSVTVVQGPSSVVITQIHTTEAPTIIINGVPQADSKAGAKRLTAKEKDQRKNGIKGQLLVKYRKGKSKKSAEDKIKKHKGKFKKRNKNLDLDVVQVPTNDEASAIADLKKDPGVLRVERDAPMFPLFTPNDEHFPQQYALNNTGQKLPGNEGRGKPDVDVDAPQAWDKTKGNGVLVAVIDSGIDESHPDLKGKIKASKNFSTSSTTDDKFGHGTFVAGIIAANTNNQIGVAGMCPECKLLNAKVLDDSGKVDSQEPIADAIQWAVDQGAKVINISIGSDKKTQTLQDAIAYAEQKNVVIVAGAGNCGGSDYAANACASQNPIIYPAGIDTVLSVASVDGTGKRADNSEYGAWVDVAAPGVDVASTTPTHPVNIYNGNVPENYAALSGTSFAGPLVAGIAALDYATGAKTASGVRNDITKNAQRISGTGTDWKNGLVNAAETVGAQADDPNKPNDDDTPDNPRPTKDKTANPNPSCHVAKPDKNKTPDTTNNPKPTKKQNKKSSDSDNTNSNIVCRLAPNLPFCNGNKKKNNTNCDNSPSTGKGNKNKTADANKKGDKVVKTANGGSGKDGSTGSSNKDGTVNVGKINDDDTTNTHVTINGKEVTNDSQADKNGKIRSLADNDINTGGQVGGNHDTEINIDKNGQNQTTDNSGSDGNQQVSGGNKKTDNAKKDDKNNKNKDKKDKDNKKNDKKDDTGKADKNAGNDGCNGNNNNKNNKNDKNNAKSGGGNSLICRILPSFKGCSDNNKNDKKDKKQARQDKRQEKQDKRQEKREDQKKQDKKDKKKDNKKKNKKDDTTPTATPSGSLTDSETPSASPSSATENSPSPSQKPGTSPTAKVGETNLALTLLLHGIGKAGDNVTPNTAGNLSPQTPDRDVSLELIDDTGSTVATPQGTVTYNKTSGAFKGTVDLGTEVTNGTYVLTVKTDHYLKRRYNFPIKITAGKTNTTPVTSLVVGDINNDDVLNILDYNELVSCAFTSDDSSSSCSDNAAADINDDGSTDLADYNLFIREVSVRSGE